MIEKEKDLTKRAGGLAVAKRMTPDQLRKRAEKGAAARWGQKLPIAIKKGNFKEHFGFDAECYVLDDDLRTAVISQTGMARVLGLSARADSLPKFLATKGMMDFVDDEIREKLTNPIKFQGGTVGAKIQPGAIIHGSDVTLLIDICQAILRANMARALGDRQKSVAAQAAIVVGASARSGIKGLVYALAGYQPRAEEVIKAFKRFVREEARKYEREFPPELYEAWYRLYEIPVYERGRPWLFKALTVRQVYYPLAQSNGKILDLIRALKASDIANQKAKLFQFLSEVGARALRLHLGRVLEMAESSPDRAVYEGKIRAKFGSNHELDLVIPEVDPTALPQPSSQSPDAPEGPAASLA
jgi:hypothetical protein